VTYFVWPSRQISADIAMHVCTHMLGDVQVLRTLVLRSAVRRRIKKKHAAADVVVTVLRSTITLAQIGRAMRYPNWPSCNECILYV
jgi:hypothetical protein